MAEKPPEKRQKKERKQLGKTKNDLKRRAKVIAREVIAGNTETNALIKAGYSPSYAQHHSDVILTNPTIKQTFQELLAKANVTDDRIAEKIDTLLDAKEVKHFAYQGEVKDQREVEALQIQAEMVKFAAKLRGHVVDKSSVEAPGIEEILQQIKSENREGR
jgi:phage terminase small subunit